MKKLAPNQLDQVRQYVRQTSPHPALAAELVDHLASLLERQLNQGYDFTTAFAQLTGQVSPQIMLDLNHQFKQTFTPPVSRLNRHPKRRPATRPFHYMFLSCALTFLLLMGGFLLIAHPMALSSGVFYPVWAIGLVGVGAVGLARWWLKRRSPNVLARS